MCSKNLFFLLQITHKNICIEWKINKKHFYFVFRTNNISTSKTHWNMFISLHSLAFSSFKESGVMKKNVDWMRFMALNFHLVCFVVLIVVNQHWSLTYAKFCVWINCEIPSVANNKKMNRVLHVYYIHVTSVMERKIVMHTDSIKADFVCEKNGKNERKTSSTLHEGTSSTTTRLFM